MDDCPLHPLDGRREAFAPSLPFSGIRWNSDWVNVSTVCAGEYMRLDGIWNVYFGPLTLGRFHERHMRIEDEYGRLNRQKV